MALKVLIAGGYGVVGANIARQIRAVSQNVELVLAGRSPEKDLTLAQELGGARTAFLDVENPASVAGAAFADLIISALYDPANALVDAFAVERVLGLDGQAPAAGGLHVPETLVQPSAAIERFRQFGVLMTSQYGDVL